MAIIFQEETMTNWESSFRGWFQGQMNAVSRIIDKHNYKVFNMVLNMHPQIKTDSIHMCKKRANYGFQVFWVIGNMGSRASETVNPPPSNIYYFDQTVVTCTKTKCSERFSVEELRMYYNGKQLHSSVIWYFFFLSFLETCFLNFQ